ncbi:unnamed protein product [Protopolystoma xenopodis]|uniref:Uncharacterized protein n=1 Tax=Protopolystoma xenopodis TaxID=117903 RepID=A0A3S5BDF9_9PLAT|nr:unnamed protein product [Protopolystoma xenopodis]
MKLSDFHFISQLKSNFSYPSTDTPNVCSQKIISQATRFRGRRTNSSSHLISTPASNTYTSSLTSSIASSSPETRSLNQPASEASFPSLSCLADCLSDKAASQISLVSPLEDECQSGTSNRWDATDDVEADDSEKTNIVRISTEQQDMPDWLTACRSYVPPVCQGLQTVFEWPEDGIDGLKTAESVSQQKNRNGRGGRARGTCVEVRQYTRVRRQATEKTGTENKGQPTCEVVYPSKEIVGLVSRTKLSNPH